MHILTVVRLTKVTLLHSSLAVGGSNASEGYLPTSPKQGVEKEDKN